MEVSPATIDDAGLLRMYAARGDAAAFAELVQRYADMVYATARRVTGSAAAAEDVAQDCFLRLAQGSAAVRGSVAAWLHRTSLNRSLEILRSERARQRREAAAAAEAGAIGRERDDAAELVSRVDEALAALPEDLRGVVTEHFLMGRNQSDIAASLGLSQPTVSRRIEKGLAQLRAWLADNGITAAMCGSLPMVFADAMKTAAPSGLRPALVKIGLSGIRGPAVAWPWFAQPAVLVAITVAGALVMGACMWWMMEPARPTQVRLNASPAAGGQASPPLAAAAGRQSREGESAPGAAELQSIIPQLPVADVSAAVQFYQTLGFRLEGNQSGVTKIIERNDEHLMLAPKVPPFDGPVTIRIEVRNVAALRKEFEASKVKIDPSPDGSNDPRRFVVTDPDRNRIVFEEDRES